MTQVVKSIGSVLSLRSLSKPTHSHILIEALFMEMLISNLEEKLYLSLPFCTSTDEAKHSVNKTLFAMCVDPMNGLGAHSKAEILQFPCLVPELMDLTRHVGLSILDSFSKQLHYCCL